MNRITKKVKSVKKNQIKMTKLEALANYLEVEESEITESFGCYDTPHGDYSVLTDSEADDAWEESIDNYIDECILPELPLSYRGYFDRKQFHYDAQMDGRAHSLSMYDGIEHELEGDYYAYRVN